MKVKPQLKIALVIILAVVAFFIIKPHLGKSKTVDTVVTVDSSKVEPTPVQTNNTGETIVETTKAVKQSHTTTPVVKKTPQPVKNVPVHSQKPVKKKPGDRENLNIEF